MIFNTIHGIIDRRILLNYRVDPGVLKKVLPPAFKPKLINGYGIGGVCLIRFKQLRPRMVPGWLGLSSENAAHRIAVEWEQDGERREGVYIPRRDTDSWLNQNLGGRLFPAIFHRRQFKVREDDSFLSLQILKSDGATEISFAGRVADQLPSTSIFPSLEAASQFFLAGAIGYSPTKSPGSYNGVELYSHNWSVLPLTIDEAKSCFFDDRKQFPAGSVELDCALLMRGIQHEWRTCPDLHLTSTQSLVTTKNI